MGFRGGIKIKGIITIKVAKTNEKTVSQLNNNLQSNELRQVPVAVCGRQCAADCRIGVQIPTQVKLCEK
jgi:hypothetical protein